MRWTGNRGTGTSGYREYGRQNVVTAQGKHDIDGSADRTFHGDRDRWNPEELLLTALSQCHMLSYLHVAVNRGIVVTDYQDDAVGTMTSNADGSGQFSSVTLRPRITIADESQLAEAADAHHEANRLCFIANSVNFPVEHEPTIIAS